MYLFKRYTKICNTSLRVKFSAEVLFKKCEQFCPYLSTFTKEILQFKVICYAFLLNYDVE